MRAPTLLSHGGGLALAAIVAATACHSGPRSPGLERRLAESALIAERDSLLLEVAANGKLLSDIEAELARVRPVRKGSPGPEAPELETTKDQRAFALEQVHGVVTRLREAQTRLAATERRVQRLAQARDSLSRGLADLAQVVATQKATVEALTGQVGSLTSENLALADSVARLSDDVNTAYFVAGTRKELIAKGVLVETGHRSIPLIGRRDVQPARDLPLKEFTSIDRSQVRRIPLPDSGRVYRIASRQSPAYLDSVTAGGRVTGEISIRSPEEFWEPSRYLILVEQ
jgi:hypothetical protein